MVTSRVEQGSLPIKETSRVPIPLDAWKYSTGRLLRDQANQEITNTFGKNIYFDHTLPYINEQDKPLYYKPLALKPEVARFHWETLNTHMEKAAIDKTTSPVIVFPTHNDVTRTLIHKSGYTAYHQEYFAAQQKAFSDIEAIQGHKHAYVIASLKEFEDYVDMAVYASILKNQGIECITLLTTYHAYARSDKNAKIDRQTRKIVPFGYETNLTVLCNILNPFDRWIQVQPHSAASQSFALETSNIPVCQLTPLPFMLHDMLDDNCALCIPDEGADATARSILQYAQAIDCQMSVIQLNKDRLGKNIVNITPLRETNGNYKNCKVLVVDDETASGSTIVNTVLFLLNQGITIENITAMVVHGKYDNEYIDTLLEQVPGLHIISTDSREERYSPKNRTLVSLADYVTQVIENDRTGNLYNRLDILLRSNDRNLFQYG